MSLNSLKSALKPVLRPALAFAEQRAAPPAVKAARRADRARARPDPGPHAVIKASVAWLCAAQDCAVGGDGGASRGYSLTEGWSPSYPETTGYIIPTLLDQTRRTGRLELAGRAKRMLDWLLTLQFPEGGFPGGVVGQQPQVPVTFNTGQILMGLAAGAALYGEPYRHAMRRAADWLAHTQDPDGCWRAYDTPFAAAGDKTYETHVSWGLLEAARVAAEDDYAAAALRQVDWALTRQNAVGWMADCCLSRPEAPLTHTIGYALRGVLEAWRFTQDEKYLAAARLMADGLAQRLEPDGFLAGRFDAKWRPAASWCCLTGSAQIAQCWLMLHEDTGAPGYLSAARRANAFVRGRVALEGDKTRRGAVAGSWPIGGEYRPYDYPNWAAKFLIDSCQLEIDVMARAAALAEQST